MVVLFDDLHGLVDVVLVAFDGQAGVMQVGAHVQHVLKQTHVVIERSKKRFNLSGYVYGTSHPIGRFSSYRPGCRPIYRQRVADGSSGLNNSAVTREHTASTLSQPFDAVKVHALSLSRAQLCNLEA